MSFKNAVKATPVYSTTANGAKTHQTSGDPLVDFFFAAGASRNSDISPLFFAAYGQDPDVAVRIALWMRDCRGGAGERESFRKILRRLYEHGETDVLRKIIPIIPVIGRWDDLLILHPMDEARSIIIEALDNRNGLCAKWMPRQGMYAEWLRAYGANMSPKHWRKWLVSLTDVVESKMCAGKWNEIEFRKVPSVAAARYQKAFTRNAPHYKEYLEALKKGEASINAAVVFPHDVIKAYYTGNKIAAQAQWDALPNYMGEHSMLPIVDVSGSMGSVQLSGGSTALHVALGLGLYCSDKLKGPFKDLVCAFSATSRIYELKGDLSAKLATLMRMQWGMNTNLQAAFAEVLRVAVRNKVTQEDMPKTLVVFSDMEFDACSDGETNFAAMKDQYKSAGYDLPNVVFWNLNARPGNLPVRFAKQGTALVSGFSPALMKTLLAGKDVNPKSIMLDAVMVDRYNWK